MNNEQEQREQLANEIEAKWPAINITFPGTSRTLADFILAREKGLRKTIDEIAMAKINEMWNKSEDVEIALTQQLSAAREALEKISNDVPISGYINGGGLKLKWIAEQALHPNPYSSLSPVTPPQAQSTAGKDGFVINQDGTWKFARPITNERKEG